MTQKMMTISCEKLGTEAQALYKRLLETWSYLIFTSVKESYNYYLVKKKQSHNTAETKSNFCNSDWKTENIKIVRWTHNQDLVALSPLSESSYLLPAPTPSPLPVKSQVQGKTGQSSNLAGIMGG